LNKIKTIAQNAVLIQKRIKREDVERIKQIMLSGIISEA
jgi:hypothetical protein